MDLLALLKSTASLLQVMSGRPSFAKTSKAEADKICNYIKTASACNWGAIAEAILVAKFCKADEDKLVDEVANRSATTIDLMYDQGAPKPSRTSTHNFESFVLYITEKVWETVKGCQLGPILQFLVQLGLKNPIEGAMHSLAMTILCVSEGFLGMPRVWGPMAERSSRTM